MATDQACRCEGPKVASTLSEEMSQAPLEVGLVEVGLVELGWFR